MKMLIPLFILGAALGAPSILDAKITREVEKTFTVQPGGRLSAVTEGGNITIQTGDTAQVRVVARQVVRASTEQEADEVLSKLKLTIEQSGGNVKAEAKFERPAGKWFGNWPPASVSFIVTVPKHYDLNLRTSGGNIEVASLRGDVDARTSGGNMTFDRIEGDLDAHTSGGNITLTEGTARAKLETSGGNISIDRAGGPTEVSTSGGNIRLNSVAQLIRASTSGGDVRAVITEPLKQDTVLSTSGGTVDVQVAKGTAFTLDASTSGGSVRAEGLTITIEKGGSGKSRLAGQVNGGGPKLQVRSSGGDVRIRAD